MVHASLAIGDDVDERLAWVKPQLGLYLGGMGAKGRNFYHNLATRYGYGEVADRIQELYLAGRKREAIEAVPDELVRGLSLIGPRGFVAERLAAFAEAGVTTMLLSPLAADPAEVHPLCRGSTANCGPPEPDHCPAFGSSSAAISHGVLVFDGAAATGAGAGASTGRVAGRRRPAAHRWVAARRPAAARHQAWPPRRCGLASSGASGSPSDFLVGIGFVGFVVLCRRCPARRRALVMDPFAPRPPPNPAGHSARRRSGSPARPSPVHAAESPPRAGGTSETGGQRIPTRQPSRT